MTVCWEPVNVSSFDLLPSRCRSGGLLLQLVTPNDTHTHTHTHSHVLDRFPLKEGSPQPDNTQHSQETNIHTSAEFEPAIPENERPQTHAATGIGSRQRAD
jgi:hypothetical protein